MKSKNEEILRKEFNDKYDNISIKIEDISNDKSE